VKASYFVRQTNCVYMLIASSLMVLKEEFLFSLFSFPCKVNFALMISCQPNLQWADLQWLV